MTLHQMCMDSMLAAPRVRPRNSDTTTGGERTRALSVSSAKRELPARVTVSSTRWSGGAHRGARAGTQTRAPAPAPMSDMEGFSFVNI